MAAVVVVRDSCHWAAGGLNDAIVNDGVEGWSLASSLLLSRCQPLERLRVIKQRHGRDVELATSLGIFDAGIDCHE